MGVVSFIVSLWLFEGWHKLAALLWAGLILLWVQQYRRWRQAKTD